VEAQMDKIGHKKVAEEVLEHFNAKNSRNLYILPQDFSKTIESSILPDQDENQNGYVHHFYNPVTGLNYANGRDNALNRALLHFAKANFAVAEDKHLTCNFEELGRAIHFITDICTPVHTGYEDAVFDTWFRGPEHLKLEAKIDEIAPNHKTKECTEYLEDCYSPHEIMQTAAIKSNELYWKYIENNTPIVKIALDSLDLAVEAVSKIFGLAQFISVNENKYGYRISMRGNFSEVAIKDEKYRILEMPDKRFAIYEKPMLGQNYRFKELIIGDKYV
jgi:hypothetical protein